MRKFRVSLVLLALLVPAGCFFDNSPALPLSPAPSPSAAAPAKARDGLSEDPAASREEAREPLLAAASAALAPAFDPGLPVGDFLTWLEAEIFPNALAELSAVTGGADDIESLLWKATGETLNVLKDRWAGLLDSPEAAKDAGIFFPRAEGLGETVLAFAGDVNLESGYVMPVYHAIGQGMAGVLTGGILEKMRAADVLLINSEFAFTERGSAVAGKGYNFRAPPSLVSLYDEMGVGVAFLANNHIYDFGADGLYDTLQTLDGAGIPHIGAGMNLEQASRPVYYIVNGRKIAYIGAGCIERYFIFTPGAGADSPGIFRADVDNSELLLTVISEAAEKSDFVVANFHWGLEGTSELEPYQRELGRLCIDAGADAVIGAHPHVLQGAEFYNGKPIVYSLGNFWFSAAERYTGVLELILDGDGAVSVRFLPCLTRNGITTLADGDLAARILGYYKSISFGVEIDGDGYITG